MIKKSILSTVALSGFIFLAFGSSGGSTSYDMSDFEDISIEPVSGEASSSGDSVGIAECDEWLERMACVYDKTGGDKSTLDTSRDAWKQSASMSKDMTQSACKSAMDSSKSVFDSQGC